MKKSLIIIFAIITIFTTPQASAIEEIELEPPKEKNWLLRARVFHEKGLVKNFEIGIIEQVQLELGYQGLITFNTFSNSSSTNDDYTYLVGDVTLKAKFRNKGEFLFRSNAARYSPKYRKFYNKFSDIFYLTPEFLNHKLLIGQARTPVGLEGGNAQYTLLLADRSMIARTFGNARPLGVRLLSELGIIDYDLGVFDSGRLMEDVGKGAEFIGWLNIKPLNHIKEKYGDLKVGGGVQAGDRENSYTVLLSGLEYKYDDFLFNTEYAIADGYNGNSISTDKAQGMYSTLAYHVTPKLQLVARYDYFDPDRGKSRNSKQEYTIGFNYYFVKQKFKGIFNFVRGINSAGADYNKFILMTQILL